MHNYGPRLCQNCPCGEKQDFLGKLTELIFLFLFCPFMWQGLKWNRQSRSSGISLHNFGDNQVKIACLVRKNVFGKFHSRHFYLLIDLYHAAKFKKKIVGVDPKIKAFIILGHNRAKIAHFAPHKALWEFPLKGCLSTYYIYPAVKFGKKLFHILRYSLA